MNVDLEGVLLLAFTNLPCAGIYLKWVVVYQEKESVSFANFCRVFLVFCNVKRIAKLAFKDDWLELLTDCHVIQLEHLMSKKVVVVLVGAEGDKRRGGKVAVLVRSQMDRVMRQLLKGFVCILKHH